MLRAAGIGFQVSPTRVDERLRPGEAVQDYVRRVASDKAHAVAGLNPGRVVLGADTVVLLDDQILGKPTDARDARHMLRRLAGRRHAVLTGVWLVCPTEGGGPGREADGESAVVRTEVEFAPLSEAEIDWYVSTDEPADKAGAYAIQGLGSRFVTRIDGSYSNVVGLPVATVYQLCTKAGILLF